MKIQVRNNCSDFNSYRAARVKSLFNCESGANFSIDADLPLEDQGWKIGVVVGPSGSGKTSIGRSIWPDVGIYDGDEGWPTDKPIVDAIAPKGGFDDVTGALSAVGLGSVPAWLRPYHALSNGEKFRALRALPGVSIKAVCAPTGGDKLAGQANLYGVPVIASGTLNAASMSEGIDLIVAAHSHDFIGQATRLRAKWGGIGYHPSLLPLHRGRDSIRWAIRMGERVTGGSVYRLSNRMDGGDVLAQRHVFIRPGDTAEELWRRDLAPLGVELLAQTVAAYAEGGYVHGAAQDEALATWEPSIDRPPAFRPDLLMIEGPKAPKPRRALPPGLHPWLAAEAEHDAGFYETLLEPA